MDTETDFNLARAVAALWQLPPAIEGAGGDRATYRAAALLVNDFGLEHDVAFICLAEWNDSNCHPAWSENELHRKLRSARNSNAANYFTCEATTARETKPKTGKTDYDLIRHVLEKFHPLEPNTIFPYGVESVKCTSPSLLPLTSEDVLPLLFPGNPLVTTGYAVSNGETKCLNEIMADCWKRQFIVPSPCLAKEGKTLAGKLSQHCKEIVGPRQWLVVETDFKPEGECGKLLNEAQLNYGLSPLDLSAFVLGHTTFVFGEMPAMIVYSGGKSLQAWYQMTGESPHHKEFMEYAVTMGADPATWSKCQFVRMPGGTRRNKPDGVQVHQPVWYFDAEACIQ